MSSSYVRFPSRIADKIRMEASTLTEPNDSINLPEQNTSRHKFMKRLYWTIFLTGTLFYIFDLFYLENINMLIAQGFAVAYMAFGFFIINRVKSYNFIGFFLLPLALVFFPYRIILFGTFVAPTVFWMFIIPIFSTYLINKKHTWTVFGLTIASMVVTVAILKIKSIRPLIVEDFSKIEFNFLASFIIVMFMITKYVYDLEDMKNRYSSLLEDRLKREGHTAKLTLLGELAGSIAHEINNPLEIINGLTYMISSTVQRNVACKESESKLTEYCNRIELTTQQISRTTKTMLKLAHKNDDTTMREVEYVEIHKMVMALVQSKLKQYSILLKFDEGLLSKKIICNPEAIAQVLINLISNSMHAIKEQEGRWIEITFVENEFLNIRVVDSGYGIKDDVLEHAFKPFYTTKKMGEGTGFGLSVSRAIAEAQGGRLYYEPHYGRTSFVLELKKHEASSQTG